MKACKVQSRKFQRLSSKTTGSHKHPKWTIPTITIRILKFEFYEQSYSHESKTQLKKVLSRFMLTLRQTTLGEESLKYIFFYFLFCENSNKGSIHYFHICVLWRGNLFCVCFCLRLIEARQPALASRQEWPCVWGLSQQYLRNYNLPHNTFTWRDPSSERQHAKVRTWKVQPREVGRGQQAVKP